MKTIGAFLALGTLTQPIWAGEPFIVEGGLSHKERLAIVVTDDTDWDTAPFNTPKAGIVYLWDNQKKQIIAPLDGIDGKGGGGGFTHANVLANWAPNDHLVAVFYRWGRRRGAFAIYKIIYEGNTPTTKASLPYSAKRQALPPLESGPDGGQIFYNVGTGPSTNTFDVHWIDSTHLSLMKYGHRKAEPITPLPHEFNSSRQIEIVYALVEGKWKVAEYRRPPEHG